jgi:hypothetical protein
MSGVLDGNLDDDEIEKGNERREGRESGMTPFVTHGPLCITIR